MSALTTHTPSSSSSKLDTATLALKSTADKHYQFFSSLPDINESWISNMKTNIPEGDKQLHAKIFRHFVGKSAGSVFATSVGRHITIDEIWIKENSSNGQTEAEVICHIPVTKEMLNAHATLHGACIAYVFDLTSSIPMFALGRALGFDGSGLTSVMNIMYHSPATEGALLRCISTSMTSNGKNMVSRCELWDVKKNRLVASTVQSKVPPRGDAWFHGSKTSSKL